MATWDYKYIIIGAGLAGASACSGIREKDQSGPIALIGDEKHSPYNRPPLSKDLWLGKTGLENIFVNPESFYKENKIALMPGITITAVDPAKKSITDKSGNVYRYEKLLLATGGRPRLLPIPGADLPGICYFRYLDDFKRLHSQAGQGKTVLIAGGGFIGSELAAALNINKLKVTLVFPEDYICKRVFPPDLAKEVQQYYIEKGIEVFNDDRPVSIAKQADKFVTRTQKNREIKSDILIVGIGIAPEIKLASSAGLKTDNGIAVNEYLQSSASDIYAAGDNAWFLCKPLGKHMRVEHWDNALKQGKLCGRNMAGAGETFEALPYFFSDLFEFSYEAVGEIDPGFNTFADWQIENRQGVIYYLKENKVRGVMLCNMRKKVSLARKLILKDEEVKEESLRGAIS